MIQVHEFWRLPDWWVAHPSDDPRLAGLRDLADTLREVLDLATDQAGDDLLPAPLELARMLRSAADEIELWTGDFGHGPTNTMAR